MRQPSSYPPPYGIRVFGIGQNVEDMNDFAFKQDAPGYRSTVDSSWVTCEELGVFTGEPVGRFDVESFALRSTYGNRVRLAKARRRLDQCVEHRLQIERRAADDLEHVGGGGLLLQADDRARRSSLSSRVFSMAMTAWAAKFLTSSICLSVKGRTSWR